VLGLPTPVTVCLFDLDGVLTQTAKVHAVAWKEMFDPFLRRRATEQGEDFVPFDAVRDYDEYVDGRPRAEGVRAFLASRRIDLPDGSSNDPPDALTVAGLGQRKNEIFLKLIQEHGVEPYDGSVRYVKAARDGGLRCCVVSSSASCHQVLAAAGIAELFEEVIDGHVAETEQLRGKPAPDTYLAGARAVGETPDHAAVFEDALVGVEAGRAGNFAIVIGVDRVGQAAALKAHGADVVVGDLRELLEAP
jgi:beta-phosphoglucomutase family hydrolase